MLFPRQEHKTLKGCLPVWNTEQRFDGHHPLRRNEPRESAALRNSIASHDESVWGNQTDPCALDPEEVARGGRTALTRVDRRPISGHVGDMKVFRGTPPGPQSSGLRADSLCRRQDSNLRPSD